MIPGSIISTPPIKPRETNWSGTGYYIPYILQRKPQRWLKANDTEWLNKIRHQEKNYGKQTRSKFWAYHRRKEKKCCACVRARACVCVPSKQPSVAPTISTNRKRNTSNNSPKNNRHQLSALPPSSTTNCTQSMYHTPSPTQLRYTLHDNRIWNLPREVKGKTGEEQTRGYHLTQNTIHREREIYI